MSVRLFCVEGNYEAVEAALKELKGIETVASLPNKKGRNVFAKFITEDDASAALEALKSNDKVVVPGEKKEKSDAQQTAASGKKKTHNVAGDFFRYDPYSGPRPTTDAAAAAGSSQQQQRQGGGGQKRQPNSNDGSRGGRGGRGGRGSRGGGRGGYQQRPRMPMIQGHVAVLDNVPVNATNDQIAKCFDGCGGAIFDINRLENMAMVYFSSTEAVQEAILKMNGKQLGSHIVTVSSGGTVRVPAPMAPPPQQEEPMSQPPIVQQHLPSSQQQ
jgi:copper chaperone CopZ